MEFLQEIARLLRKKRQKKVEIFNHLPKKSSKKKGLTKIVALAGLLEEGITDDETTAKRIYGEPLQKCKTRLHSLRHDLLNRMLDTLFFLKVTRATNSNYIAAQYACIKGVGQLKILQLFAGRNALRTHALRLISLAKRYDLYDTLAESYRSLSLYHGLRGEVSAFERFTNEEEHCQRVLAAERQAEYYCRWCTVRYAAYSSPRPDLLRHITNYLHITKELCSQYGTYKLHYAYLELARIAAEVGQEYDKVVAIADEAVAYYDAHPQFYSGPRAAVFLLSAMAVNVWQACYEEAGRYAVKLDKMYAGGTANWYYFKEIHLLLALRSGNGTLAEQLFRQAIRHERFDNSNPLTIEKWTLLEFYTRFLTGVDFPETLISKSFDSSGAYFRDFRKMFPKISHDGSGYGLTLVIAHITYLLSVYDVDSIITYNEALQATRRRFHTKDGTLYRIGCFLRMVHIMVTHNFDRKRTEKAAQSWLRKMSGVKEFYRGTAESMEVLPLERLWEMCLGYLETNGELLTAGLAAHRQRLQRQAEEQAVGNKTASDSQDHETADKR